VRDDAFLLATIHAQPDPVVGVDADGRVRAWNAGAAAAFGFDEDAAHGVELRVLLGVDARTAADRAVVEARARGGACFDVVVERVLLTDRAPPAIVALLVLRAEPDAAARVHVDELPPRLRQTLDGLCAGLAEKEIAAQLGLSPHTVHDYVRTLYKRFGVQNRAGLVARVLVGRFAPGREP
jgi:DNA-binding NarL/FixJ family response regulator